MGIPTIMLKGIKDETCPTCGARIEMIEQTNLHTNGWYNEYARYTCGAVQHYSPNFRRVMSKRRCPNHPISKIVDSVDKDIKERLNRAITKALRSVSLPAEDDHLLHELQEALKHISNDVRDQVHHAIKRHLY